MDVILAARLILFHYIVMLYFTLNKCYINFLLKHYVVFQCDVKDTYWVMIVI